MENIDIDKDNLKNIDIDMAILENIDIDKGILQNIDIDKISYRLGFGISNTPSNTYALIAHLCVCVCIQFYVCVDSVTVSMSYWVW